MASGAILAGLAWSGLLLLPAAAQTNTPAQPAPSAAADTPKVRVELNKLEPRDATCRAYFLIENASGAPAMTSLKLDLFFLDPDGIVERRLAVETAPLAASKTVVKQFDIADLPCARIGKVLLNDVLTCVEANGAAASGTCLDRVTTASRAPKVAFIQ